MLQSGRDNRMNVTITVEIDGETFYSNNEDASWASLNVRYPGELFRFATPMLRFRKYRRATVNSSI